MVKWAGIATVAGALRRNVCVKLQQSPVYPNMYILLIGGPGVGKSRAIMSGRELLMQTPVHISPAMTTKESFLMRLGMPENHERVPGWMTLDLDHPFGVDARSYVSCAVAVMSEEFTNFVQEDDTLFMDALTELYDSPKVFEKFTKTAGSDVLQNVTVTMVGGTTPDALRRVLPDAAFKQGFASRLNLIYSDENIRKSLFGGEPEVYGSGLNDLKIDLNSIAMLKGEYKFTPEAEREFDAWYMSGMRPAPSHPRLVTYNERRHIHLAKLMMIHAASRSNELLLTMDDLRSATETLLESEIYLPEALARMGTIDEAMKLDDAVAFMKAWMEKHPDLKAMPEMELRAFLVRRVKPQEVGTVVSEMLSSGLIENVAGLPGARLLRPK